MLHRSRTSTKEDDHCFNSGLNVLFLASFPLVLWFFQGSAVLVVTAVIQMALLSAGLRLISNGQRVHRAYDSARVAKRPRLPRKFLGSSLIGLVVLILAGHHFVSLGIPMAMGVLATALSLAAFGMDPLKDKGINDPEVLARQESDGMLAGVDQQLKLLSDRVAALGDADLRLRTDAAREMVTRLLRALVQDTTVTMKLLKPTQKFTEILSAEVERLEEACDSDDYLFARRKYMAKLQVLTQSYEDRLRKFGGHRKGDAFEFQADLLLDRMNRDSAA